MQRNAVIMSRLRAKKADTESKNDTDSDEETSVLESIRKNDEGERRFVNFWQGIRQGVSVAERRPRFERKQMVQGKKTKRAAVVNESVFHPNSSWRLIWDITLACMVVYSIIIIPYQIGMVVDPDPVSDIIDYFLTVCFGVDILLNFNTAYLDPVTEKLEYGRREIWNNYISFWFWIDLLATIPFDSIIGTFIEASKFRTIRIIRILRLMRLVKIYRLFSEDEKLEKYFSNPALLSLFVLIIQIFYVAHIFACFFHYISLPGALGSFPQTWVQKFGFAERSVQDRYIAALYFVIITMSTVGYGDIYGTNQLERFYAILTMLTGGIVFGALVGRVTSLIDKRNPQAKAFKEKMNEFKSFLADCKIPVDVANRAKASYIYYLSRRSAFGEAGIIGELPRSLVKDLVYELYHDDIEDINMFKSIESAFVIEMITHSRPFHAYTEENIFVEGDVCNEIIFVKDGCIRIIASTGARQVVIGCVTEGDYFGDAEFLKNTTALATYQAIYSSHLVSIPHSVMARALAACSNETATQLNRWMTARYTNLASLLRSKGIHAKPARPPPRTLKRTGTLGRFALRRSRSSGRQNSFKKSESHGTSIFNLRALFERGSEPDEFQDEEDDSPSQQHQPQHHSIFDSPTKKKRLTTMSRNLWINGEIKDSSASMAFLTIGDKMKGPKDKVRIVIVNADGFEEAVERPGSILKENWLLNPVGPRKVQWDFFIGMLIIFSVLIVPVEIAYNGEAFAGSDTVGLVINGFFFVDIVLSFVTAIESKKLEALIIDKQKISRKYLRSWFLIDVISTVPFDDIVSASSSSSNNLSFTKLVKIIRLLRLLKLARVLKLGAYIEKIEDSMGISPIVFSLIALLVQVFFIAHWTSCLWYGLTSIISAEPWFQNYADHAQGLGFFPLELDRGKVSAKYLMSLYYTLTTMTTVGYGDIRPSTMHERALGIVLALCGASLFGYMIANVSGSLSSLGGASSSAKEHLSEVTEYLKEKNCPSILQERIKNHFKRQVKESSAYDVDTIVERLPSMISTHILYYLNEKRMSNIAFFKFLSNKSVAVYLLQKMSPVYCDVGQYLFREDEYCKEISFFVSGEAHAFRQRRKLKSRRNYVEPTGYTEESLIDDMLASKLGYKRLKEIESMHMMEDEGDEKVDEDEDGVVVEGGGSKGGVKFTLPSSHAIYEDMPVTQTQESAEVDLGMVYTEVDEIAPMSDLAPPQRQTAQEDVGPRRVSFLDSSVGSAKRLSNATRPVPEVPPLSIDHSALVNARRRGSADSLVSEGDRSSVGSIETPPVERSGMLSRLPSLKSSLKPPKSESRTETPDLESGEDSSKKQKKSRFFKSLTIDTSLNPFRRASFASTPKPGYDSVRSSPPAQDDDNVSRLSMESASDRGGQHSPTTAPTPTPRRQRRNSHLANDQHAQFMKGTLSFIVNNRESVAAKDPIDEMAKRRKKLLVTLSPNDYETIGLSFISKLEAGDFVGHAPFLRDSARERDILSEKHDSTVRAVMPSTVYVFSKQEIIRLIRQEPTVAIQFQAALREAVVEQSMVRGKHHIQNERAHFLRTLRRKYHVMRKRAMKRIGIMSPRLSMKTLRSTTSTPANARPVSKAPAFSFLPSASRFSVTMSVSMDDLPVGRQSSSLSLEMMTMREGSVASGREGSVQGSVGYSDGATTPKSPRSGGAAAVNNLLHAEKLYYDSDDSQEDKLRQKRDRVGRMTPLQRAWHKVVKTISNATHEHKELPPLKRTISMSAIDFGVFEPEDVEQTMSRKARRRSSVRQTKTFTVSPLAGDPNATKTVLVRRQSFPSYDNKKWRKMKAEDVMI